METVDWRIVFGSESFTEADRLTPQQAQLLLDASILRFGEVEFSVRDIPMAEERAAALHMFEEEFAAPQYRLVATLAGFLQRTNLLNS